MVSSGQQYSSKNLKQFKCPLHMSITYIHTFMHACIIHICHKHTCLCYIHVHSRYMHTDITYMNARTHTYTFRYMCVHLVHTYTYCMHTCTCAHVCMHACAQKPVLCSTPQCPPLAATNNSLKVSGS